MNDAAKTIWQTLASLPRPRLEILFADDPQRVERLSSRLDLPGGAILFDWSKTHLDLAHVDDFSALAEIMDFPGKRAAMVAGGIANSSENRAAEHMAMRGFGSEESVALAGEYHARMHALVEAIHGGALGEVRHLVHIGIGGSALGPELALDALARDGAMIDVHIVSNIDGLALEEAFGACDPEKTLVAIASKSFTTIETMTNAASTLAWLEQNGVPDPYGRVVALTASPDRAIAWGVDETRILPFMATVGGRWSLWSSIGFPVALALGWEDFGQMLEGAAAMDQHFLTHDGAENLPLRAAFADQLYARLRGCQSRAVFAYDERLRLFPAYLQQLEMESNGKSVMVGGLPVSGASAPVTWGGVGTDAQHAVFQLLHQGTHMVPVDFIAAIQPADLLDPVHHRMLLMNCLAQGAALMSGRTSIDPAKVCPGDRPSATILCDDLNPATLGALIAFHEHRTFANAVLTGINPFDQFGVELGKEIVEALEAGDGAFDPSTEALLKAAGVSND